MRLRLIAAILLVAGPALADPPARYTLDLTSKEVDYLGEILAEQKLKDAMPLYQKMQAQVREQQAKVATPPKAPDAPPPPPQ